VQVTIPKFKVVTLLAVETAGPVHPVPPLHEIVPVVVGAVELTNVIPVGNVSASVMPVLLPFGTRMSTE
jgi:hypothetical protein